MCVYVWKENDRYYSSHNHDLIQINAKQLCIYQLALFFISLSLPVLL